MTQESQNDDLTQDEEALMADVSSAIREILLRSSESATECGMESTDYIIGILAAAFQSLAGLSIHFGVPKSKFVLFASMAYDNEDDDDGD